MANRFLMRLSLVQAFTVHFFSICVLFFGVILIEHTHLKSASTDGNNQMAELEATIGMGIKLWAYNLNVIQILTANYTLLNCEAAYNTNIGSIISVI